jgi:anaerobic ribonucleoside-triphosphate reductase activating protein
MPMPDLTITLDCLTGSVLLEHPERLPEAVRTGLVRDLGPAREVGCARPARVLPPPSDPRPARPDVPSVRLAGYYHASLIEGPGRRSCALLSGCDLRCAGCAVPALHPLEAGVRVPVDRLADELLDPDHLRDGVSLLGGEPLLQAEGLLALVRALRARGCSHILLYSGRTYGELRRRAAARPAIGEVLDEVDMLLDGPFVAALADRAGPWTGSGNQQVIAATRTAHRTRALLGPSSPPIVWDDELGRNIGDRQPAAARRTDAATAIVRGTGC